ncbi:MAG TPA: ATP-binding protein [Thermodesulfobacteriota bacterium]|nr:ATP-binding protein [Thermodesulfobacteriota bacterium]
MKHSIFSKIFGSYILIVLLLSTLILLFSFRIFKNFYIGSVTDELKLLGNALEPEVTPFLKEKRFQSLDALVKDLGSKIKTRITVIDPQGVVLADSQKDPRLMENHRNRPEIIQTLTSGVGSFSRYSTTIKNDMLYVALPVRANGKTVGIIRLSVLLKDLHSLLAILQKEIFKSVLIVIVICLIGTFIFLKSLTRPIKKLNRALQKVASGDFEAKVFLKRNDEVKQLADSFNLMTDQIKTLFEELSFQKENLNSIFVSIQEGFAVLDEKGRIILSNESFKKITQTKSADGKLYWEVIRDVKFGELVKMLRENKRNLSEEIELNGKFYLSSATFLAPREQIVIVFSDITETKNMEKIKRDFVVNVSHELRTPLTAIKGFAETLEEESGENVKTYAEVIKRNTDRLINIVQDLLLLSELEEKGNKLESEEINLKHLVDNIVRIFKSRLTDKGLDFELRVEDGLPALKGDSFKLEQMLINLIDNAIKYTEKGKVSLALKQKNGTVEIIVEDTGIGIPQEHLGRIFERFYVVDKSRSKKLGGTGLGLSIVKHIVLLHKGTIAVESSLARGTTFTIMLPC